jgi:hypothetical protein
MSDLEKKELESFQSKAVDEIMRNEKIFNFVNKYNLDIKRFAFDLYQFNNEDLKCKHCPGIVKCCKLPARQEGILDIYGGSLHVNYLPCQKMNGFDNFILSNYYIEDFALTLKDINKTKYVNFIAELGKLEAHPLMQIISEDKSVIDVLKISAGKYAKNGKKVLYINCRENQISINTMLYSDELKEDFILYFNKLCQADMLFLIGLGDETITRNYREMFLEPLLKEYSKKYIVLQTEYTSEELQTLYTSTRLNKIILKFQQKKI